MFFDVPLLAILSVLKNQTAFYIHPNLFKPKRCFHNGGSAFFVKEDLFWGRKIISLVAVGKPMILAELISVTVGARGKIYA